METSSISKDGSNKVGIWTDVDENYNVKASGANRPEFVPSAINGFPAIDFTGANVGLCSDIKYSKAPNDPFTWIMAVQPSDSNGVTNLFTTGDNNWSALNTGRNDYYPIAAAINGIHGWSTTNDLNNIRLPTKQLTIYTIWYDGSKAKVYWGNVMKGELTTRNWNRGPKGYVVMGLGMQNWPHQYSGYIGEVLAYDVALDQNALTSIIDAMTTKWTIGTSWKPGIINNPN